MPPSTSTSATRARPRCPRVAPRWCFPNCCARPTCSPASRPPPRSAGTRFPQAPHGILATRREVLGHLLAELGDPRVGLDQRHVTVWPCRIHLATAPVTRDGEQVEVTPARHDLWAPPDPLVNRILGTVVALRDA